MGKIPRQDMWWTKKTRFPEGSGLWRKVGATLPTRSFSGPKKVKAIKPATKVGCHSLLLWIVCLKKQKTADFALRSTG